MIKRMFRVLLLALAALCSFAQDPGGAAIARMEQGLRPTVHVTGEPVEHFDIRSRMALYGVPGVSVAVINNYKLDWAKGYGDRDRDRGLPVDSETLFEAGSISKPVAATGALWLVDRRKL